MRLRPGDEDLEESEIDVEAHLGLPISMFEGMSQPVLISFVTMARGPEPPNASSPTNTPTRPRACATAALLTPSARTSAALLG